MSTNFHFLTLQWPALAEAAAKVEAFANSDPRQWLDRYIGKFGNPGFAVENVGNVPELRVEDNSACPSSDSQITNDETAAARDLALRFARRLAEERAFDPLADEFFVPDLTNRVLRNGTASPLAPEVAPAVLDEANADDLAGYFFARNTLTYLGGSTPVAEAIRWMDELNYRHMPVTENGRVIGVISWRDLPYEDRTRVLPELEQRHALAERIW